jgi:two-component system chemotaxis response regulator CheB
LALELGALSVLDKPVNVFDPSFNVTSKRITTLIRSMAEIKLIKRRFSIHPENKPPIMFHRTENGLRNYEIVTFGSSVGGPQALKNILSKLPSNFPVPIVIVQHMAHGFIGGLTKWLNQHSSLNIKCAESHEVLQAGTVYLAPDHHHLKVKRVGSKLIANLDKGEPVSGFYPSITVLLDSIAETCGDKAVAALLTGMGSDGASGLLEIKSQKGHTIIQDPESCIVFGMAGIAQSLGAVDKVVKLNEIAAYLSKLIT